MCKTHAMPEAGLLTAGRHLAGLRARAGFGLGALAFASVELAHLHAGQAARLKAQQLAAVFCVVPGGFGEVVQSIHRHQQMPSDFACDGNDKGIFGGKFPV